ncbi:MAG: HPP family protein [Halobacteriaceae archaeon]
MDDSFALRDVMRREFVGVAEGDDLRETVALLDAESSEYAVVLDGADAVGLIGPSVVYGALGGDREGSPSVGEVMVDVPAVLGPGDRLGEALDLLGGDGPGAVVVADTEGVIGIVTAHDALSALSARPNAGSNAPRQAEPEPGSVAAAANTEADDDSYSRQSVCEACGSLSADLAEFNGQLLCPDCREV